MENKVVNDLLGYDLKIIQSTDMFSFSLDSVLLANFVDQLKPGFSLIDFGTNNAVIPLILANKNKNIEITGIEIQAEACVIAEENVKLNHFEQQIKIVNQDIKEYASENAARKVNIIVCNPPFFKLTKASNLNVKEELSIARHEVKITLEEIIVAAARLLENKGVLYLTHRPERLTEIIVLMNQYGFQVKLLQFVHPKNGKNANMILVKATFRGNQGLKVLPALIAHDDDGNYSAKIKEIFAR